MPDKFTHEQLRVAAIAFAKRRGYDNIGCHKLGLGLGVIASETVTTANDIPDVIGWAYGLSYLIECKASKADFNADAKKPQRSNGTGMGNFRYYFTPVGLIAPSELPQDWGHIVWDGKKAFINVRPTQREIDTSAHIQEKRVLLSLLRRINMREFLIIQKEEEPRA